MTIKELGKIIPSNKLYTVTYINGKLQGGTIKLKDATIRAVSYTHLTLPTNSLV